MENIESIKTSLREGKLSSRLDAIEQVGDENLTELVSSLKSLLDDDDSEIRAESLEAMAQFKGIELPIKAIQARLEDENELVRVSAAESLGAIGYPESVPVLESQLTDPSPLVRSFIVDAIVRILGKDSIHILRNQLAKEQAERVQVSIFVALYSFRSDITVFDLQKLFCSLSDYRSRCAMLNLVRYSDIPLEDTKDWMKFLDSAAIEEPTVAVRSSIDTLRNRLD